MNPRTFLFVTFSLALAAAGIVAYEESTADQVSPSAVEFQQLVGGLGLGSELNSSRCAYAFDPRLSSDCFGLRDSLLDSHRFCTCHSFSVSPLSWLPASELPSLRFLWNAALD